MTHYVKLDSKNYVVGVSEGIAPGADWIATQTAPPPLGLRRVRYINGGFVTTEESWAPAPSYDLNRSRAYPSLGDQMDMLWHAMNTGALPRVEPFYSQIRAVKEEFPKHPPA